MKRKDKTKDIFYNAVDYLVMLVIIIGVITILGWKFELLFNKGTVDDSNAIITEHTEKDVNPTTKDTIQKDIKEIDKIDSENSSADDSNSDNNSNNETNNENAVVDENNTDSQDETETQTSETDNNSSSETNNESTPTSNGDDVTINIPAGTLPGATGQILADNGLVESAEAFVNKAVELKLDRKLKSGEFKLKKGMSLDAIVKAIAKL